MVSNKKRIINSNINESILEVLITYFPTKEPKHILLDVINILMDGLLRGEVYINVEKISSNIEIKSPGWPKTHIKALKASLWIEGDNSPINFANNEISWRRFHYEMEQCIEELLYRSKSKVYSPENKNDISIFNNSEILNYDQQKAVNLIINNKVILLSGGPGTGKTSTILNMIVHAFSIRPNISIGLAAPTGKATKRLQESIENGIKTFDISNKEIFTMTQCKTIHKWLKASPNGFGQNKNNRLNIDLLVVDEMSMVDINLFQALLDALPKQSQLILVGDPNQLPPIGIGAVWNKLHQKKIQKLFNDSSIHLKKVYRNQGDLALLGEIICAEGINAFWQKLALLKNEKSNVKLFNSSLTNLPKTIFNIINDHKHKVKELSKKAADSIPLDYWSSSTVEIDTTKEVEKVFIRLSNLFILCPRKNGYGGVKNLNELFLGSSVEEELSKWEEGTPVICGNNQPDLGLSNGDIGLIIRKGAEKRILFNLLSEEQKLVTRLIHPARVKSLEPAFAMTIHKAQGSEANHVILIWPYSPINIDSNIHTGNDEEFQKKLIYTAITRAKKQVDIIIDAQLY